MQLEVSRRELTPWNLESGASSFLRALFYLTWRPFSSPQLNQFLINFVPCISHTPPWMLQELKFFLQLQLLGPSEVTRNPSLSVLAQRGIYHRYSRLPLFSTIASLVRRVLPTLSILLQMRVIRKFLWVPLWSWHRLTMLLGADMLTELVNQKGAKFFVAQWGAVWLAVWQILPNASLEVRWFISPHLSLRGSLHYGFLQTWLVASE